jgi:hypothetical protein
MDMENTISNREFPERKACKRAVSCQKNNADVKIDGE